MPAPQRHHTGPDPPIGQVRPTPTPLPNRQTLRTGLPAGGRITVTFPPGRRTAR
ncbi:hypothetical protein SAMN05421869_121150 [Nonomuraea jiangxiensis]|uniref:Uncharacterized protein n=1 Tax=Nonomuraea jiangxiensis TaxID=633440 RepID=A0A1G9GUS8_9ACTN|nr:hypothetical protein SAMN05421869_121150 [Nonomuraea jiangxiensis]